MKAISFNLRLKGKYDSTLTTLSKLSTPSTSVYYNSEAGDGLILQKGSTVSQHLLLGGLAPQGRVRGHLACVKCEHLVTRIRNTLTREARLEHCNRRRSRKS